MCMGKKDAESEKKINQKKSFFSGRMIAKILKEYLLRLKDDISSGLK